MTRIDLRFKMPSTLNQIIDTARRNRYESAARKKSDTRYIQRLCSKVRERFVDKVYISATFYTPTKRNDPCDNLPASLKPIMDGIVKAGIIKDDSLNYIHPEIVYRYERGDYLVDVTISDTPIYKIVPL